MVMIPCSYVGRPGHPTLIPHRLMLQKAHHVGFGARAQKLQRIAAPMVGGMMTAPGRLSSQVKIHHGVKKL